LSLIDRQGAREKWEQAFTGVHIPCTGFPQVQYCTVFLIDADFAAFVSIFSPRAETVHRTGTGGPEENSDYF